MEYLMIPDWPPGLNNFVLFGAILLIGLVGGQLAHRTRFLPRITGFILIGLMFGPSGLGLLSAEMLQSTKVFVDIALGLILFQLGLQLDFKALRGSPNVLVTGMLESLASFGAIYWALTSLGINNIAAALAAAVGISASPAVLLLVIREFNASGRVTQTSLELVAINNILAFFAYSLVLPIVHYENQAGWMTALLQPAYQILGSLMVAYILAWLTIHLGRLTGKGESAQFPLLVGAIILGLGVAEMVGVSKLLTLLSMGVMVRNHDLRNDIEDVKFGKAADIFFIMLFVIAGANLHLHELTIVGWAAVAFVVARYIGKQAILFFIGRLAGLEAKQVFAVGLALTPMAGMAIGLTQSTSSMYPQFGHEFMAIVLGAVAILETIGPVATEYALRMSGEVDPALEVVH